MEMDNIIINTLDRVGMGKIKPSQNIIDESLSFNVRDLDLISDTELTKFIVGLSRHIIYIVLEINKLKIQKIILEREVTTAVAVFVAKNNITKATKVEKRAMAIDSSAKLLEKDKKLQEFIIELTLLEGIDKYLEFYTNALKHDRSRREHELDYKAR